MDWREQVAHIPDDLLNKIKKNNFSQAQKIVEKHIRENPRSKYNSLIIKQMREKLDHLKYFVKTADISSN